MGGNVIYLEEAAAMKKDVVFKVVIPLLEVAGTALIAISTPLKKSNFYSELCDLRDHTGQQVFNVLQVTLSCPQCDAAKAAGSTVTVCAHSLNRLPKWKDAEKHTLVKLIYEQVGRGGDYDRESRGMITDDGDSAFPGPWIESLSAKPPFYYNGAPEFLLVTCDPNGGGFSSDTAIVSAYYHEGAMVICGLESHPTQRDEKTNLLAAHIKGLRSVRRFRSARIYFVPENNLDDAARALVATVATMPNLTVYSQDGLLEGARTKAWTKIQYTQAASHYLSTDHVSFDTELVCANPYAAAHSRTAETRAEFLHQLKQWRKLVYSGDTAKGAPYVTCSGKTDDNGMIVRGQKDDLCMAFVMNAFFAKKVASESPLY